MTITSLLLAYDYVIWLFINLFEIDKRKFCIQLGAAAVNLVAGEKPADVYSGIAAR